MLPFFRFSSYDSYIVCANLATIISILCVKNFAESFNVKPLQYVFSFWFIFIAEHALYLFSAYKILNASGCIKKKVFNVVNLPFNDVAFASGPILTTVKSLFKFLGTEFASQSKPTHPVPTAQATIAPLQNLKDDVQFTSLFLKDFTPKQEPSNAPLPKPFAVNPFTPNFSLQAIFKQQLINPEMSELNVAKAGLQHYPTIETARPEVSYTNSGIPVKKQPTIPKLKYTPCVQPPLQPTAHRERLLWFLSPTPEVVDDFRIEQMIDLQKNWNKYNDRTSRVYYDKMTAVLLKKIFIPLSESIDFYNQMLTPKNRSVANCPPATVLLSMVMPNVHNVVFTLPEIETFINIDGYTHVDGREYVVSRIKDLASSSRMQTYRFLPTVPGMPTDAIIIEHVFQHYLNLKEPHAIPPLVPFEGDLFKFLLVYIKITPELNHWNVFDLSDQL